MTNTVQSARAEKVAHDLQAEEDDEFTEDSEDYEYEPVRAPVVRRKKKKAMQMLSMSLAMGLGIGLGMASLGLGVAIAGHRTGSGMENFGRQTIKELSKIKLIEIKVQMAPPPFVNNKEGAA